MQHTPSCRPTALIVRARLLYICLMLGLGAMIASAPWTAAARETGRSVERLGADLDGLLQHVRRFSPELAAAALEREAAAARAEAADSLPDPRFRASFEDIDRRPGSLAPERLGSIFYSVEQEFPLWGKRGLRKRIALAEADSLRGREETAALDLAARVKTVHALHFRAIEAARITHELHTLLHSVANVVQARVAQGLAGQRDALDVEAEKTVLLVTLVELERERRTAEARLNALLDRPPGSSLAVPQALRPVPPPAALRLDDLMQRALDRNPLLATHKAEIAAAEGGRSLAERAWHPDVTLGVTAVDRERQFTGYEAMVAFKIPLRWGLKEAELSAATARLGASGKQLEAARARIRGALEEAYLSLEASRRVEALLRTTLLPQVQAAYRASLAEYQQGRGGLQPVLLAEHRARQAQLDLLKVQAEQQGFLAEIERLIGGEL